MLPGGVCLWSLGVVLQGVSASGPGGCIPAWNGAEPPPWTEFLTHATENITLPQLHCGL